MIERVTIGEITEIAQEEDGVYLQIREEYEGVDINGQKQRLWLQFNKIEFLNENLVDVEMGLMYDYESNPWGIAYWGLEVYFMRNDQNEWIIDRTNILAI